MSPFYDTTDNITSWILFGEPWLRTVDTDMGVAINSIISIIRQWTVVVFCVAAINFVVTVITETLNWNQLTGICSSRFWSSSAFARLSFWSSTTSSGPSPSPSPSAVSSFSFGSDACDFLRNKDLRDLPDDVFWKNNKLLINTLQNWCVYQNNTFVHLGKKDCYKHVLYR